MWGFSIDEERRMQMRFFQLYKWSDQLNPLNMADPKIVLTMAEIKAAKAAPWL